MGSVLPYGVVIVISRAKTHDYNVPSYRYSSYLWKHKLIATALLLFHSLATTLATTLTTTLTTTITTTITTRIIVVANEVIALASSLSSYCITSQARGPRSNVHIPQNWDL